MSSNEVITNVSSVDGDKLDATINQYEDYNDFIQHCSNEEFKAITDRFAECGFNFLKERAAFRRLPIQERIERVVKAFKNRLIKQAGAIAEFNNAYCAGGTHGGRTSIREGINALFSFCIANFPNIKKIMTTLVFDIVKGKKFIAYCDESVKLVNDIVLELKSDKEAWGLLGDTSAKFIKEINKFKKNITKPDSLEFIGHISIYDVSGKLLSADAISKKFNEQYCEQLRRQIKNRVLELHHRFDEEFTEFLKKGIPADKALVELSKRYNGTVPTKVTTENELEKELKSNDPEVLKALFERLV